jgi:hypothetical protein
MLLSRKYACGCKLSCAAIFFENGKPLGLHFIDLAIKNNIRIVKNTII